MDNSKAAFFQCPAPLPKEVQTERQSSCQHKEGAVGRETWEYRSDTAMSSGNEGAKGRESAKATWWSAADDYKTNRELQRNNLKLRWHLRASLMFPVPNQGCFCEGTGFVSASRGNTSVPPTERMHPRARQTSDLSESLTCTILLLARKDSVAAIMLQHHQH